MIILLVFNDLPIATLLSSCNITFQTIYTKARQVNIDTQLVDCRERMQYVYSY